MRVKLTASMRTRVLAATSLLAACLLLAAIFFALAPALAQTRLQTQAETEARAEQGIIAEVFSETAAVRGLAADPDIAVNYLTREELEARILEDFTEENPEEELAVEQRIMVMLGYIPPDLDLEDFYIALLTEQIAGFYDAEENGLYLISESQSMSPMGRFTLSHELVHYLQDENFDLMRPPFHDPDEAEEETDDDASFAATCLVEGDAVMTSERWLTRYMDAQDMVDMYAESRGYSSKVLDSAPPYICESLLFPYTQGAEFVRYLYGDGGYDAVNRAFSEPPSTTEQIYHPEKYLAGEMAVEVSLEDISARLGAGWELAYDNVLGEFDVYQLFAPYFSRKAEVAAAADGWGGNRYHYYSDGGGGELLLQSYAWDSEEDAQEFAAAYAKYVGERFGEEAESEDPAGAWMVWSAGDYRLALKRDGVNTELVQATAAEPFAAAIAALGEEGDAIDEGALEKAAGKAPEETDLSWVVISLVLGLLVLGVILVAVMLFTYRRPPSPPAGQFPPPPAQAPPASQFPPPPAQAPLASQFPPPPAQAPPTGQFPPPPIQAPPALGTEGAQSPEMEPGE